MKCGYALVWIACAACQKHSGATRDGVPSATVTLTTPSASASAAVVRPQPPLDDSACAAFRAQSKLAIVTVIGDADPPNTPVGYCKPTPGGSWRVDMPSATVIAKWGETYSIEARYSIVHVGNDGARHEFLPDEQLLNYGGRKAETPVAFDFDGDGEPELYVAVREEGEEGHFALQKDLVTFDGHTVKPYAPARSFDVDGLQDVDRDGRPDLKIHAKYTDTLEGCGAGFPYDWPETRFVAHSRPDGTFSTDDAAARAYARAWCPAAPTRIKSSEDAICARLWAKTPDEIAKARKLVACVPGWCEREIAQKPQPPGAAEDCERRVKWFDQPPPFTLP